MGTALNPEFKTTFKVISDSAKRLKTNGFR